MVIRTHLVMDWQPRATKNENILRWLIGPTNWNMFLTFKCWNTEKGVTWKIRKLLFQNNFFRLPCIKSADWKTSNSRNLSAFEIIMERNSDFSFHRKKRKSLFLLFCSPRNQNQSWSRRMFFFGHKKAQKLVFDFFSVFRFSPGVKRGSSIHVCCRHCHTVTLTFLWKIRSLF